MGKKAVIISTSPRHDSNSHALAEAFYKGALDAGNEAELISLRGKKIAFCLGCFACQEKGECVIKDDAVGNGLSHHALHAVSKIKMPVLGIEDKTA